MNEKLYPVRIGCSFKENSNGTKTVRRTLTPRKAVRLRCLDCSAWIPSEVKNCTHKHCILYPYRMGEGRISVKTIRKECIACMDGQHLLVKGCSDGACSLYSFRMGKNPNIQLSEEQKQKLLNNLTGNEIK